MMKRFTVSPISIALVAASVAIAATAQTANAWDIVRDSYLDSTGSAGIGGTEYELYRMGMHQVGDTVFVAIDANMGLQGNAYSSAQNGSIDWGDLVFNFGDQAAYDGSDAANLFGIRFAANNESGVTELGLYQNVTTKSVTSTNAGHASFNSYNNTVKRSDALGDVAANAYFQQDQRAQNVIATGQKVANDEFKLLNAADLQAQGYDQTQAGRYLFGFSFKKTEGMMGAFMAHIFAECANDGVVLAGNFADASNASVPEPSTAVGLVLLSLTTASGQLLRRRMC